MSDRRGAGALPKRRMSSRKGFSSPPSPKKGKWTPAVKDLSGMPLNDDIVKKIKAKMKLKRLVALEVVSSRFAALGTVKHKPMLDFFPGNANFCRLSIRTKGEALARWRLALNKLEEVLESVVVRFRKLRSVNVHTSDSCLVKTLLDGLMRVTANYAEMEIRRFSTGNPLCNVLLPSFVQWINQFASGLRRLDGLKLHLTHGQFPLVNDFIQALRLCQNLRRLDLLFLTNMGSGNYLNMLTVLKTPPLDNNTHPLSPPLATAIIDILIKLSHLHTLRLIGNSFQHSYLAIDYPHAATRHTLSISESWLPFIRELAFKAFLCKMENFKMHMRALPLSDVMLRRLCQILGQMQPSAGASFHELECGSWQGTPLHTQLTNWLLLAKQTQKHVQICTRRSLLTPEQLTDALAVLPIAGIVESEVVAAEFRFYFQFGNGGRLTIQCEEESVVEVSNDDDSYFGYEDYKSYFDYDNFDYDNYSSPSGSDSPDLNDDDERD